MQESQEEYQELNDNELQSIAGGGLAMKLAGFYERVWNKLTDPLGPPEGAIPAGNVSGKAG